MNPFTMLPPQVRRVVYIVFGVLGLVLIGLEAGYTDAPGWVDVYQRVYGAVAPLVGITAAANVGAPGEPEEQGSAVETGEEPPVEDDGTVPGG